MKRMPLLFLPILAACSSASAYMRPSESGGPLGENEARVIFIRPSRWAGSAITFGIWDRQKLLGFAEQGSSFEVRCAPGRYLFLAMGETVKAIDAELDARKTYYIWVTPRMGILTAAVGFTPVTRDSDLGPKVWKELVKTRRRELIPEYAAEIERKARETMLHLVKEFEGERRDEVLKLRPEDGFPEALTGRNPEIEP